MYGPQTSKYVSLKIILTLDCRKEEAIYMFKLYPKEHNGTILLMYEARTKQLATPPAYYGANNYSNPRRPKG